MMDAYTEKTNDKGETRVILKLTPELAPIKVAVLPLAKNNAEIVAMARASSGTCSRMRAVYDDTGGIGKLYARQDEIGTPFCVTVDHDRWTTGGDGQAIAIPGNRNASTSTNCKQYLTSRLK